MSYQTLSIKEAIEHVNNPLSNGWFLPAVQRPYVWGSRYENEKYICKLFDSLLRGYPIGALILWNTKEKVPFREFIRDYNRQEIPRIVDEGRWSREDKWLVYDGQQRIQTLYSCLVHTFGDKVLIYDLTYDLENEENNSEETGFFFVEKQGSVHPYCIRMNMIFSKNTDDKYDFSEEIINNSKDLVTDETKRRIKKNLDNIWRVFVESDKKSLAYFPISDKGESKVNDIFQRLNTGGVPLSQTDLLLSKIKGASKDLYDFEESLQLFSRDLFKSTGTGYQFSSNILQFLHLLIKDTIRVDPRKVTNRELLEFR